jgi:ABC-type lipoprotein release transport system permease subunit
LNLKKYITSNLRYYWRTNLNVLLGAILSAGILVGALIIGDSVKYSLQQLVVSRIGNTESVIYSFDRFFQADLADRVGLKVGMNTASILQLRGLAIANGGEKRAPNIQICGIDEQFWKMGGVEMNFDSFAEDEVVLNQKLASDLCLKEGDEFLLRIEKARFVSMNTPFVQDDKNSVAVRLTVKYIASEKQFGNYNLQNSQTAPSNVFISRKYLSKLMAFENKANIILLGRKDSAGLNVPVQTLELSNAIKDVWKIDDLNLKFRKIPELNQIELTSNQIFIDDLFYRQIKLIDATSTTVFTYFVNSIRKDSLETPYSFITGLEYGFAKELKENEIILNAWTAGDLKAKEGDNIELSYFIIGPLRTLKVEKTVFKIKAIVPISGLAADTCLMPDFEGLSNVENCSDWESGIPIDFGKIRPKDENYWKTYKGIPKAYVSYLSAKKFWGTKFGNCTAIRFNDSVDINKISKNLLTKLNPSETGMMIRAVKDEGMWSANNGVDFGQLFLGLSFFLLVAALILTGLLFSLNIDMREKEQGILLALGFRIGVVKKILVTEGLIIALIACFFGSLLGIFLNQIVLFFLNSAWNEIVRTSSIQIHVKLATVLTGCAISFVMAALVMFFTIRRKSKFSIRELQQKNLHYLKSIANRKPIVSLSISIICTIAIFVLVFIVRKENLYQNSGLFFLIGSLILIVLLAFTTFLLNVFQKKQSEELSFIRLAIRNIAYKQKRSIATISLLAIGTFLVVSTGLNRTDFYSNWQERTSGTGGFLFYAETTLPVRFDLNTKQGREKAGFMDTINNVSFVQIKTFSGDDASCLNLNRIMKPRIIGLNPAEFISRKAFSFVQTDRIIGETDPWLALNTSYGKNIFPAIADQTVIQWGMGKSIGDTLLYVNEKGDSIRLKLIAGLSNSIFQGNIIISNQVFDDNFPTVSGSNIILVEAPIQKTKEIKEQLLTTFNNNGISITTTAERLTMFNSVTNTYLDIFLFLGGIALVLSTIGIAILIFRNILEKSQELAMMQAFGIKRSDIFKIIVIENIIILKLGVIIGLMAAITATIPSLVSASMEVPYLFIIKLLILLFANGIGWIALTTRSALNKNILVNLRNE